jgi:hypothetical protein
MCGRKMKSSEAVKNWQGMWRHQRCNEPRQTQDFVRALPDKETVPFSQPPSINYLQIDLVLPITASLLYTPFIYTDAGNILATDSGLGFTTIAALPFTAFASIPGWVDIQSILWTWQSGGVGIAINSPNTALTTFTLTDITDSGVALCTVTSTEGGVGTATCNIN